MSTPMQDLVPLILEAKRFFELGIPKEGDELDNIQKGVVSRLTVHWYPRTTNPERASS